MKSLWLRDSGLFPVTPLIKVGNFEKAKALGLLFCVLIITFVLAFVLSLAFFNDAKITKHLRDAVAAGALTAEEFPTSPFGHTGHKFDMWSECVGLSVNLGNSDRSLLYRLAASPSIDVPGVAKNGDTHLRPCADLVQALEATPNAETPFFRFWHGYQIYFRALLSIGTLYTVHVCNAILLYSAVVYLCIKLTQWFGWLAAPICFLPYALFSDLLTAPLVTVHALSLAWSFFSIACAMTLLDADRTPSFRLFLFSFASGCVYNFIAQLHTPQLAPAFIAFVIIADGFRKADASLDWRRTLWIAFLIAGVWFCGYFATWIAKWSLAALVLGFDVVKTSVASEASGVSYSSHDFLEGRHLPATWYVLGFRFLLGVAAALGLVCATFAIRALYRTGVKAMAREWLLLQSPLLIIIVWTEASRYHSVEHRVFAQRGLLLCAIFPLLALLLELKKDHNRAVEAPVIASFDDDAGNRSYNNT